jgi:hypothetical protein
LIVVLEALMPRRAPLPIPLIHRFGVQQNASLMNDFRICGGAHMFTFVRIANGAGHNRPGHPGRHRQSSPPLSGEADSNITQVAAGITSIHAAVLISQNRQMPDM